MSYVVYLNVSMRLRKTARRQSGFGIVEVVIAIALLGVLSLALTGMFQSIVSIQAAARNQKLATLAAQRQIESLRNSNYNNLTAGSSINFTGTLPADLPSPKTGSVAISEPVSGLKRVDVTVSYRQYGVNKQVIVSSTIGIIGITK